MSSSPGGSDRDECAAASTVAALYVEKDGAYYGIPGVDPWDEERDARLYAGPWPVVAHPPCKAWCALAGMRETRYGYKVGDDGGCFEAALNAVRIYGGVLEHPAHSLAWPAFELPRPLRAGSWVASLDGPGWSCWVDQGRYGHPLKKPTWLYYVGPQPPAMKWGYGLGTSLPHRDAGLSATQRERMTVPTPPAFRDVLLDMARRAGRLADTIPISGDVGGWSARFLPDEPPAASFYDQRIDTLKLAYPNEADFIEALRGSSPTELVEQVVLYYRDAKRLYAGTVKP